MIFYFIGLFFTVLAALAEGISDAIIIKRAGRISHKIYDRVVYMMICSIGTALTFMDGQGTVLGAALTIILIVANLSSIYWIVFELVLNYKMRWGLFHVGTTAATDQKLRSMFGQYVELALVIMKITLATGTSYLVYYCLS